VYLVSLLHGSIALPALTLAGVLLIDAAAGVFPVVARPQAGNAAARSDLRLARAAAALRLDGPRGECTIIED
jgi:hypothetical protein